MDSFDKGWFVLQTYSGYENKVKENLLQRAQTYNMLDNILRVEIPTQTVQVEKKWKEKRSRRKSLSRLCSCRNGHDR
ncbi:transcription antitermination protein NusG [Streptococcus pneumoniae]|nr:transcription antitermination protein NusG [Streptococcus pneumoniae]